MSGRRFAYVGVAVGLAVSVAANVAHAATGGRSVWAMAMSGFWPLALFLALEILTRTQWSGGRALVVARLGVGMVAAVAAALSYDHLRGLHVSFGEAPWAAVIGPLAVDGLMAVSAAALLTGDGHAASEPDLDQLEVPDDRLEVSDDRLEVDGRSSRGERRRTQPIRQPSPELDDNGRESTTGRERSGPDAAVGASGRARSGAAVASIPAPGRGPLVTPAGGRVSDEQLLAQVDALVTSGQLTVEEVTGNRLRSQLRLGAERAGRVSALWHARRAGGAVLHRAAGFGSG